jgi:hypothetical protein
MVGSTNVVTSICHFVSWKSLVEAGFFQAGFRWPRAKFSPRTLTKSTSELPNTGKG